MKRLAGIEVGTVIARDDPDGLGRVRVRVPGIVGGESPNWAEPYGGTGGGSAQRGTFDPPAVGANVGVFFRRGDPDFPCYICGPHGAPGGTTDVPTDGEVEGDDRQNAVLEDEEWLIQRDSRSAAVPQRWRVQHKSTGVEIVIDAGAREKLESYANSRRPTPRGSIRSKRGSVSSPERRFEEAPFGVPRSLAKKSTSS